MAKKEDADVLIINTGGTIGMVHSDSNPLSPLIPVKNWRQIAKNHPVLDPPQLGVTTDMHAFDPLVDSSNIQADNWKAMADVISEKYDDYTGFVILHGTDTMCYTAAALSFMLKHLGKPVIITGSQVPLVEARSDAVQNLVTAIQLAAPAKFDVPVIPEVCIFFRDELLRGNRARKISSSGYSGFESPNYSPLAAAGEHIEIKKEFVRALPNASESFVANAFLDTAVMVLEIFPGFDPNVLRHIFPKTLPEDKKIKGLILKTFGAGNAPDNPEFLSAIEYVATQGTIIVDVTQCPQGMVELGLYEASSALLNRGVITGVDLTPEAAVCKLMHLLGLRLPTEEVRRQMQLDRCGEQSLNVYNIEFSRTDEANPLFRSSQMIPGEIDFLKLKTAALRFRGAEFLSVSNGVKQSETRIFFNHPGADHTTPASDPRCTSPVQTKVGSEKKRQDLFADVTPACRRLLERGQMAAVTVANSDCGLRWEEMTLSLYCSVL